ncbi:MAG: serine hydrolase [Gemmataceae bacterium]
MILGTATTASAQAPDRYAPAVQRLDALVAREATDKRLPAVCVAVVDDQRTIWAKGFGFRDAGGKLPAGSGTAHRVGSVSKLFTDVAIMQLVEQGKVDIDAPVSKYLPDFRPAEKSGEKPITLRMLMAHRSGLLREPPVGSYFDPTHPSLADTVKSVNGLPLVYPPGERTRYSNAGISVVGRVLEVLVGERFEDAVKKRVLDPLEMTESAFELTPKVRQKLADAVMWTYHGREFPAPTFDMGMGPAGSLYAPVTDLSKFASCLFAGGKTPTGRLLKPETLVAMMTPQFVGKDAKRGFGIGFSVGELDGHKRVGHGGAVYGFATEFAALPDDKLAVIVVASRDVANTTVSRIATDGLRLMLAAKEGKPLPETSPATTPLTASEARKLAGHYTDGDRWVDVTASGPHAYLWVDRATDRIELRKRGDHLWGDDAQSWGPKVEANGDDLVVAGRTYKRAKSDAPPPAPPAKWAGLLGEYGWDHNTLFIFEWHGRLYALIEWTELDQLTEESETVFAFPPDRGMYHGERLVFTRDGAGRATKVVASGVSFDRRKVDGENGETFKITPRRPLDFIRLEAMVSDPPDEAGDFRTPDLVDLATVSPTLKFDIRYATTNNFLGTPFYTSDRAFLQKPAAEALGRVHAKLKDQGYGLLVFDAYRPWHVTKMFWDATPPKFRGFVADPDKGSRHNRGCAVDLTLYDLKTGKPVEMPSGYDEFSDRAYPDYPAGTTRQRWHRDLLRAAMEGEGFTVYEAEWWHFDFKDWKQYPILNLRFEDLK